MKGSVSQKSSSSRMRPYSANTASLNFLVGPCNNPRLAHGYRPVSNISGGVGPGPASGRLSDTPELIINSTGILRQMDSKLLIKQAETSIGQPNFRKKLGVIESSNNIESQHIDTHSEAKRPLSGKWHRDEDKSVGATTAVKHTQVSQFIAASKSKANETLHNAEVIDFDSFFIDQTAKLDQFKRQNSFAHKKQLAIHEQQKPSLAQAITKPVSKQKQLPTKKQSKPGQSHSASAKVFTKLSRPQTAAIRPAPSIQSSLIRNIDYLNVGNPAPNIPNASFFKQRPQSAIKFVTNSDECKPVEMSSSNNDSFCKLTVDFTLPASPIRTKKDEKGISYISLKKQFAEKSALNFEYTDVAIEEQEDFSGAMQQVQKLGADTKRALINRIKQALQARKMRLPSEEYFASENSLQGGQPDEDLLALDKMLAAEKQNQLDADSDTYYMYRIMNQNHLQYLFEHDKDQYKRYKEWESKATNEDDTKNSKEQKQAQTADLPTDSDIVQIDVTPRRTPNQTLHSQYFNALSRKIQETSQAIRLAMSKKPHLQSESAPVEKYLSLAECQTVELLMRPESKNIKKTLEILQKLQYFRVLTPERRQRILQISTVQVYQLDETIIHKDKRADYLYIIVKGWVEKQLNKNIGGIKTTMTESVFQGEIFGYLQKPQDFSEEENHRNQEEIKRKRRMTAGCYSYSVQAKDRTTVLRLPYATYLSIQTQLIKSELSLKIKALKFIPCFQHASEDDLIPLASLLVEKTYKNAETIIAQGDLPQNLFIMTKGVATISKKDLITRKKTQHDWGISRQPVFYPSNKPNSLHKRPESAGNSARRKAGTSRLLVEDEQKYAYEYQYKIKEIYPGEVFMSRAFLYGVDSHRQKYGTKAKLSIIAESNDCEFFVLSSEDVRSVPDYLQKHLTKFCLNHKDYDSGFNEVEDLKLKKWEKYKQSLCRQILENKANSRLNRVFP